MTERRHFPVVLRRRCRRVQEYFATARRQYPRTREALRLLQAALDVEVPRPVEPTVSQRKRKGEVAPGAGAGAATGALEAAAPRERRWFYQARRFRQERDALAEKVRRLSGAKDSRNMLSEEWLLRVILSHPNASARSVEQSFADIVGSDVRTVSRASLNAVRDAFVELYKPMVLKAGAALVALCATRAKQDKAAFAPVFLLQVQDEADIRCGARMLGMARQSPAEAALQRFSRARSSYMARASQR